MRLLLRAPAHFRYSDDDTLIIDGGGQSGRGFVHLVHPRQMPEAPRAYMQSLVSRDLPEGGVLVEITANDAQTYSHFPLTFVQAQVAVPGGAEKAAAIVESRIAAFYRFFEYVAAAVVTKLEPSYYRAHHLELVDVLSSARPDFRGVEPVALSELWQVE